MPARPHLQGFIAAINWKRAGKVTRVLARAITVSPLTTAILGAIEPARSGIASAVNNAVSRVAGLMTIAALGAIVGGKLDLDGFHRAAIVTAVLMAAAGIVSFIGIRNRKPAESAADVAR